MPIDSSSTTTVDATPPEKTDNQKNADLPNSQVTTPEMKAPEVLVQRSEPRAVEPLGLEPTPEFQRGLDDAKEAKHTTGITELNNEQSADLGNSHTQRVDQSMARETERTAGRPGESAEHGNGQEPQDGPPGSSSDGRTGRPDGTPAESHTTGEMPFATRDLGLKGKIRNGVGAMGALIALNLAPYVHPVEIPDSQKRDAPQEIRAAAPEPLPAAAEEAVLKEVEVVEDEIQEEFVDLEKRSKKSEGGPGRGGRSNESL